MSKRDPKLFIQDMIEAIEKNGEIYFFNGDVRGFCKEWNGC